MTNLDRLYDEIAHEEDILLSGGQRRVVARRRLLLGSIQPRTSTRRMLMPLAFAAVLVLGGTGATLKWQSRQTQGITADFGKSRTPVSNGDWLTAPETTTVPLRFSDGTQVEVAPRSRMRLIELGTRGAQLALESGRADVDVTHGDNRRWELRAGPYVVRVTGTRFNLSWSPNEDQFDLVLNEGQVELLGCAFGSGKKLVAGQRVHASCRENLVEIAYSHDAATPAKLPAETQPSTAGAVHDAGSDVDCPLAIPATGVNSASAELTGASSSSGSSAEPVRVDWITLARKGRHADAFAAVNRLGFSAECARVPANELALLGDTARHARDVEKARLAYTLLRQRFSGSKSAGLAAFYLGVLEFDQLGAYSKAAQWFRTYLKENPSGPLTREARGRLMEALHRSHSVEASSFATHYLRDYPSGPHAQLARRIVSSR